MRKNERNIYFYDVLSKTWNRKYKGIKSFPHFEILEALFSLYKTRKAYYINSRKQAIYVADMKILPSSCEMLIGFSDTLAADPAFSDWVNKKRRIEKKIGDEGIEHSAHIIWRFGNKDNNNSCPLLLEHAPGISSTRISAFINRLLRSFAKSNPKFMVDDPAGQKDNGGNFKKIETRPMIELTGHPSAEFIKDLKKGELKQIELYTEKDKGTPWDAHGRVIEDRSSVTINSNPDKALGKAKALLDSFVPKHKKKYEFARIRFKTESDIVRDVNVLSENYNLVNSNMYVRKERITDIGDNLPTAFAKIYTPIIVKMRQLK